MKHKRTIYVDLDFKCHVTNDGTMIAVETDFFDGMCDEFIEGHCFVPVGYEFVLPDGTVLCGRTIAPWKSYDELDSAQREYERKLISEYESALDESVRLSDLDAAYQEGVNAAYDR